MDKYRDLLKLGIRPHEAVEMLGEPHRVTETKYYRRTDWQWFNLHDEAREFDALTRGERDARRWQESECVFPC